MVFWYFEISTVAGLRHINAELWLKTFASNAEDNRHRGDQFQNREWFWRRYGLAVSHRNAGDADNQEVEITIGTTIILIR